MIRQSLLREAAWEATQTLVILFWLGWMFRLATADVFARLYPQEPAAGEIGGVVATALFIPFIALVIAFGPFLTFRGMGGRVALHVAGILLVAHLTLLLLQAFLP